MKKIEFDSVMKTYYNELKGTFGDANVKVAQTTNLSWCNKLFAIKSRFHKGDMIEDGFLIIRVSLKNNHPGEEIWGVSPYFSYSGSSTGIPADQEKEIVTAAGELLEHTVDGFVICETGNVKVNISINSTTDWLSQILGQQNCHVV